MLFNDIIKAVTLVPPSEPTEAKKFIKQEKKFPNDLCFMSVNNWSAFDIKTKKKLFTINLLTSLSMLKVISKDKQR